MVGRLQHAFHGLTISGKQPGVGRAPVPQWAIILDTHPCAASAAARPSGLPPHRLRLVARPRSRAAARVVTCHCTPPIRGSLGETRTRTAEPHSYRRTRHSYRHYAHHYAITAITDARSSLPLHLAQSARPKRSVDLYAIPVRRAAMAAARMAMATAPWRSESRTSYGGATCRPWRSAVPHRQRHARLVGWLWPAPSSTTRARCATIATRRICAQPKRRAPRSLALL